MIFRNGTTIKPKLVIMKPTDNGHGYKIIGLRKPGLKKKNYYVHQLVAKAFIPNVNNYKIINHKDFNRGNNIVDNLEWCTQLYNNNYSRPNKHGHGKKPVMKISPQSGKKLAEYESIEFASKATGVSTTFISDCCKGKCKLAKRLYLAIYQINSYEFQLLTEIILRNKASSQ